MPTLFIISGETSGDEHGALLVRELKARRPDLRVVGGGGPRMKAEGVEVVADTTIHATVGIFETLQRIGAYSRTWHLLLAALRREKPDAAVLIDYPDFNLRFAERVKDQAIPLVYYISPQLWAWREGRVKAVKRLVDRMVVIFPFEEGFYRGHGVPVTWVGHPLAERLDATPSREEARRALGVPPEARLVGLFPGSRRKEVQRHLPILRDAAERIARALPGTEFLLGCAPGIPASWATPPIRAVEGRTHEAMRASDLVLVKSGTSTLEAAVLGAPMVVFYKVSWVSRLALGPFLRTDTFAMANILAGRKAAPELIQRDCTAERIAGEAVRLFRDGGLASMRAAWAEVRKKLGPAGAAGRAAEEVLRVMDARRG